MAATRCSPRLARSRGADGPRLQTIEGLIVGISTTIASPMTNAAGTLPNCFKSLG